MSCFRRICGVVARDVHKSLRRTKTPRPLASVAAGVAESLERRLVLSDAAPIELETIGHWGGVVQEVAVNGQYAYVGTPSSVRVLDVSDPALPRQVGGMGLADGVTDIEIVGNVAYVTTGREGLQILDISDPTRPRRIGAYDTPGVSQDVEVVGTLAYIADFEDGVHIVDVSDPANPYRVGGFDTPGYAQHLNVVGTTVYVADAQEGVRILDISDPANPQLLGVYELDQSITGLANAMDVRVANGIAYVAAHNDGLQIVDVRDPAEPVLLSVYWDGYAWLQNTVQIMGDVALFASHDYLKLLDVSDPASPTELGAYRTDGSLQNEWTVRVAGNLVYMPARYGLDIVDITDPRTPRLLTRTEWLYAYAVDVKVVGARGYVTGLYQGLRILDLNDPNNPVQLGSYPTPGYWGADDPHPVEVAGRFAYLSARVTRDQSRVYILDIDDPGAPVMVGQWMVGGAVYDLQAVGELVYVASDSGLRIVSVTDAANPVVLGQFPGRGRSVQVVGNHVYYGECVLEVSDPTHPVQLSRLPVGSPVKVQVIGSIAYAADATGLRTIDVSDPARPVQLGQYTPPGTNLNTSGVQIVGGLAYVTFERLGVHVVDVGDPAHPVLRGTRSTPDAFWRPAAVGDQLYGAARQGGLVVLRAVGDSPTGGTEGADGYHLARSGEELRLYRTGAGTSTPEMAYSLSDALRIEGLGGADTLTVDFSSGNPIPAAGLAFAGKEGNDRILFTGATPDGLLAALEGKVLDLADNELIITADSPQDAAALLPVIEGLVASARTSAGDWSGSGITSSVAAAREDGLAGLSVMLRGSEVRVKLTWNGDVNQDGRIDAEDYFRLDSGFLAQSGGYGNGDFNFDGVVDPADYFLIDAAFLGQSGVLAATPAKTLVASAKANEGALKTKARRARIDALRCYSVHPRR